jgi:hypothetical protein
MSNAVASLRRASFRDPALSSLALPKYLHRRSSIFYFKRKTPADVVDAFPQ